MGDAPAETAPAETDSLIECAVKVLLCPSPERKAAWTVQVVAWWRRGGMAIRPAAGASDQKFWAPPARPGRADDKARAEHRLLLAQQRAPPTPCTPMRQWQPAPCCVQVRLVQPHEIPKRGKGGTLESRQAMLHSLVHIENWAIDLSWDIIARFGGLGYDMPRYGGCVCGGGGGGPPPRPRGGGGGGGGAPAPPPPAAAPPRSD